ncbi:ABC transporter permease [Lutispora saccharofermentans]|uniref:ABC transporter permease n=1 Tax=Lutispora saccharofermentans TaxID=3024236 RepID=A0ABT1NK79_9FIRM|nr:ABC transporter permease [Lutispora saccharofermentans]MCQ1530538.1 ABC transporter permease [Lutispora saccharofermentans]
MNFFKRALCYIRRKKSKSILLISCFFIMSTMILCATIVLMTAQATSDSLKEKTGSKLVLENQQGINNISAESIALISGLDSVSRINRAARATAYPTDFSPVTYIDSADTANFTVTLHAYDNTEIDGLFAEEKYRLLEGNPITEKRGGVIIDSILADANGLSIGDMITFRTEAGASASGEIVGIFFSGMERQQEKSVMSVYRIENQVFVDHGIFASLFTSYDFSKLSVYAADPDALTTLHQQIESIIDDSISITSSDALYQQIQAPLKQIIRITSLILALIVATAIIVISLLLCMWMRTRKKEMAVLISLGVSKLDLFLQAITESLSLLCLAIIGATTCSSLFLNKLMNNLFSSDSFIGIANIRLEGQHVLMLILLGSAIVLLTVGISISPTLYTNPRDTLSRMEG